MKELMQEIYEIEREYNKESGCWESLSSVLEYYQQCPLKSNWREPPTDEDKETQEKLIGLFTKLYEMSEPQDSWSYSDSDTNSHSFYPFKELSTGKYFAFHKGYNSWGDCDLDDGVYEVKATPVLEYSVIS